MTQGISSTDKRSWMMLCDLESQIPGEIGLQWHKIQDKVAVIRDALSRFDNLRTALHMIILHDELHHVGKAVFQELIGSVSSVHGQISLCRTAIKNLPFVWVKPIIIDTMMAEIERQKQSPHWESDHESEAYQRFAELLAEMDLQLLKKLADLATVHANPEVQEVGYDINKFLIVSQTSE